MKHLSSEDSDSNLKTFSYLQKIAIPRKIFTVKLVYQATPKKLLKCSKTFKKPFSKRCKNVKKWTEKFCVRGYGSVLVFLNSGVRGYTWVYPPTY